MSSFKRTVSTLAQQRSRFFLPSSLPPFPTPSLVFEVLRACQASAFCYAMPTRLAPEPTGSGFRPGYPPVSPFFALPSPCNTLRFCEEHTSLSGLALERLRRLAHYSVPPIPHRPSLLSLFLPLFSLPFLVLFAMYPPRFLKSESSCAPWSPTYSRNTTLDNNGSAVYRFDVYRFDEYTPFPRSSCLIYSRLVPLCITSRTHPTQSGPLPRPLEGQDTCSSPHPHVFAPLFRINSLINTDSLHPCLSQMLYAIFANPCTLSAPCSKKFRPSGPRTACSRGATAAAARIALSRESGAYSVRQAPFTS
ncbi:hypothetical protein DFH09DRAFT_1342460 [Mycena vulgaris]|nr:hypothetical protein DFH09DRAFT_1342460 [Mycena vulgaris]